MHLISAELWRSLLVELCARNMPETFGGVGTTLREAHGPTTPLSQRYVLTLYLGFFAR